MKQMNLARIFFLLFVVTAMTGCFRSPSELIVKEDRIDIFDNNGSATVGVMVKDKNGKLMEKAKPAFTSDDVSIATIDEAGKITAKSSGSTSISIQYKKLSKTVPVTVMIVDSLKLEPGIPGVYEAIGPEKSSFKVIITAKNERGEDIEPSILRLTSSDTKVATVDEKGELTLLSDGKVKIAASAGKKKANLELSVTVLRPSAVKVDAANLVIGVGQTAYLPFTVISTKGTPIINYPVSVEFEKEGIATADEIGQVTGVASGTTKLVVRAGEASNSLTLRVK